MRFVFKYLFFIIVLFYCLILSQFGFENWDSGFYTANSWRILNGQIPYQDFIYIRPPVVAYFHALILLFLPTSSQVLLYKIIGYLIYALTSYFSVSSLDKIYNFKTIEIDKWFLMSICFVSSVHFIFPEPIPQTDAAFFASLSMFLLTHVNKNLVLKYFFVALTCMLATLTKQSFYFLPLFFGLSIYLFFGKIPFIFFSFSILIFYSLFITLLFKFNLLELFFEQTNNKSNLRDFLYFGLEIYIRCFNNKYLFLGAFIIPLFYFFYSKYRLSLWQYLKSLSITYLLISLLLIFFIDFRKISNIWLCVVLISYISVVKLNFESIKKHSLLIPIIGISWCVALSVGYPFVILYSCGVILPIVILLKEELFNFKIKPITFTILLLIMVYSVSLNQYLYRENHITKLNYKLDEISYKLKHIKTSKEYFEKWKDLKQIITKYNTKNFVVAPSMPLSHYVFNSINPAPSDWLTNFEINNQIESTYHIFKTTKPLVLIEKSFIEGESLFLKSTIKEKKEFSALAFKIYNENKPLEETNCFYIYRNIK